MKKLMLIMGPLGTRSGYGDHARDIFHSFYQSNNYDIVVWDTRWGDCPRNALDENNPKDKIILDCISPEHKIDRQPDVYVDVRVPNEFQQIGKFNIGITAGIETTVVSGPWLDGANKMDLVIVPSEHSKSCFWNAGYEKHKKLPDGNVVPAGQLVIEPPIEVVFEGEDIESWKKLNDDELKSFDIVDSINQNIPEDFAFLFVGQWTKGGYGEDRKDIGRTIKVFLETFANTENPPALIMKTNGASYSVLDREAILHKIRDVKSKFPKSIKLPNIYLIHGSLSQDDMNALYNHPKIKAMVSFTHGEGFGRPMLEATLVGLPVIASSWSGQLDFLSQDNSILVGGDLNKIPESAVWENVIIPESEWFTINETEAAKSLKFAHQSSEALSEAADKLMKINRDKFSHSSMTRVLNDIVDKWINSYDSRDGEWVGPDNKKRKYNLDGKVVFSDKQPEQVSFKLPVLEKA